MAGNRDRGDEARNGLSGEIDGLDAAKNNAGNGFFAEGDEDELTGEEILVGGIS